MIENTTQMMVVGAGQMGAGIAQLLAMNDFDVVLQDISDISLQKARCSVITSLNKLYEKGVLNKLPQGIISRIKFTTDISKANTCKVIIESVFEDFEAKSNVINSLNQYTDNNTYIATNTSSFSISELARFTSYPENFVGFHFMNPVILMDLIEVVKGIRTTDETVRFFIALAYRLDKTPICVKNSPGFVLNRILIPMINEAIWALYEGVSSMEQIDTAMKLGANHKIGPLALADLIGLDTVLAILRTLQDSIDCNKYAPCPLLSQYVAANRLGKKSTIGFYDYRNK